MDMKFVRGRRERMVSVGWQDNVMVIEFKGGKRYAYGGVPKEVADKLLRVPFPDSLFSKIVKGKYVGQKVDDVPAAKPQPEPELSFDDPLPF